MSLVHSPVFYFCKEGKRRYEPGKAPDYEASRRSELRQNRSAQAPPPRSAFRPVSSLTASWRAMRRTQRPRRWLITAVHLEDCHG